MNKKLILLPVLAMLLVGCGTKKAEDKKDDEGGDTPTPEVVRDGKSAATAWTIEELLAATASLDVNGVTSSVVYATGVVAEGSTYNFVQNSATGFFQGYEAATTEEKKQVEFYAADFGSGVQGDFAGNYALDGATVIVSGYFKRYNSGKDGATDIWEFTSNDNTFPEIVSVTGGKGHTPLSGKGATADNPLTVDEAIALCEELGETGKYTVDAYFIAGDAVVTSAWSSSYKNVSLDMAGSNSKKLVLYRVGAAADVSTSVLKKNAELTVVVKASLQNYKGNTPETFVGQLTSVSE